MRARIAEFSMPLVVALVFVGLTMVGLLAGYRPVTGDPDVLYLPIKTELSRALRQGTLPFWADRFGLGVPLVAESHAAAFYPPNWLLYGTLQAETAYRISMWLHYMALVATTYGYARVLRLNDRGAAIAAVAFTLCGFQMSHSCHEPFYSALPFLPLALALAEQFLTTGRPVVLGALAVSLGVQITLGHFQIPTWTLGLVVLTGLWRAGTRQSTWRRFGGLLVAVVWAFAVAAPQVLLTAELKLQSNFGRTSSQLMRYAFPPERWAQAVFPQLFNTMRQGSLSYYWATRMTSSDEATFYVGALPLVLACIGFFAPRDRPLTLWRWLAPAALVVATLPAWWSTGYELLMMVPGLGSFRAPGRYVMIASLGLCLLAGRALDDLVPARRFWTGLGFAAVLGASATAWAVYWSSRTEILGWIDTAARPGLLAQGVGSLAVALACAGWYRARPRAAAFWVLLLFTGGELAYLYHHGSVPWGWPVEFPGDSPVFAALARQKEVGLVAGNLQDLPPIAGFTVAYPEMGIAPPQPTYLLEIPADPQEWDPRRFRWADRAGVTHGVFDVPGSPRESTIVYEGPDPVLDRLLPVSRKFPLPRTYRVERYKTAFPPAHLATSTQIAEDWYILYAAVSHYDDPNAVFYVQGQVPPEYPGPHARNARILDWDGRSCRVEHDGTVDLVVRRAWYPGWTVQLDDDREFPVLSADNRFQAVRIPGQGTTRVRFRYRPRALKLAILVALGGIAAALYCIRFPRDRVV